MQNALLVSFVCSPFPSVLIPQTSLRNYEFLNRRKLFDMSRFKMKTICLLYLIPTRMGWIVCSLSSEIKNLFPNYDSSCLNNLTSTDCSFPIDFSNSPILPYILICLITWSACLRLQLLPNLTFFRLFPIITQHILLPPPPSLNWLIYYFTAFILITRRVK